jgi:transcriptional regulator with GAF, ATPase, and Fis domain
VGRADKGGNEVNGLAVREHSDIRLVNRGGEENSSCALKQLALRLLLEAQTLNEVPTLDVRDGIDFYEEVRRFEVDLIQSALSHTDGNQVRAARLLNMKVTTLNSKIKHYNISVDVLVGGYAFTHNASERRA